MIIMIMILAFFVTRHSREYNHPSRYTGLTAFPTVAVMEFVTTPSPHSISVRTGHDHDHHDHVAVSPSSSWSRLSWWTNAHWSLVRSRLVFNYQACVDIKGSQAQREEAQVDHYHQIYHNDHNQMIIVWWSWWLPSHWSRPFQCLAHWKEGSTYYFVAMMNSSHVARQQLESSFRWSRWW